MHYQLSCVFVIRDHAYQLAVYLFYVTMPVACSRDAMGIRVNVKYDGIIRYVICTNASIIVEDSCSKVSRRGTNMARCLIGE